MDRKQSISGASSAREPTWTGRTDTASSSVSSKPRARRGGLSSSDRQRELEYAPTETQEIDSSSLELTTLISWLYTKFPRHYSKNPLQPQQVRVTPGSEPVSLADRHPYSTQRRGEGAPTETLHYEAGIISQDDSDDELQVPGPSVAAKLPIYRVHVPRRLTREELREIDGLRGVSVGDGRRLAEREAFTDDEDDDEDWDSGDRKSRQVRIRQRDEALRFDRLSINEGPRSPRSQAGVGEYRPGSSRRQGHHNDPSSSSIDPYRPALHNNAAFLSNNALSLYPEADNEIGLAGAGPPTDIEPGDAMPTNPYYQNRSFNNAAFSNNNAAFLNNNALPLYSATGGEAGVTSSGSLMYSNLDGTPATDPYYESRVVEPDSPKSKRGGRNKNRKDQDRAVQSSGQRSSYYT